MNAAVAFDQLIRGESPAKPDDSLQVDNPERFAGIAPVDPAARGHGPLPALFPEIVGLCPRFLPGQLVARLSAW